MIKITTRETGEQITLDQCAKEHGAIQHWELMMNATLKGVYLRFDTWCMPIPFDSSRFKLEIANEAK